MPTVTYQRRTKTGKIITVTRKTKGTVKPKFDPNANPSKNKTPGGRKTIKIKPPKRVTLKKEKLIKK